MMVNLRKLAVGFMAAQLGLTLLAQDGRDLSFDGDWRFLRGHALGADSPAYNDSQWRKLDLPHDWSIEDLPPKTNGLPQLAAVAGMWRFHKGDEAAWKLRKLDDRDWQSVTLPDTWEHHSSYTNDYVFGWFRRRIGIPAECRGQDFELLLGKIDDADETFFNGQRIGGMGSFPPNYRTAWDAVRRYRVPASLVRGDGSDELAVRVFNGVKNGGIYETGTNAMRIGPFDARDSENQDRTGFVLGGAGWYRKHFTVDETNKLVAVRFDGVYMNADFWVNGHFLGNHPYGYTSFEFDLTPFLNPPGQENLLAVRVKNEGRNSRWYSGSGIYRHTWLTVREPLHVPTWGVFVTTPEVTNGMACVKISSEICNAANSGANAWVRVQVLDAAGKSVGHAESPPLALAAKETRSSDEVVNIRQPELWSPDSPRLYTARVEVWADGRQVDAVSAGFGIRKIEVDAEHGLRFNGEVLKLKGGCVHHDNGALGAAAIDRAEERKVELMKANGFNAVRTSHNPPSPAFLDACDRLGLLVIDEAFDQWNEAKIGNEQDYHRYFNEWHERDIASMVQRDRNHPSVLMWSIGNEIPEQFRAGATAQSLRKAVLTHDPTRPITAAICTDWGHVMRNWDELSDAAFIFLDVGGYNYLPEKYEPDHARQPQRVMMGTESYPKDFFAYWSLVEEHPYVIGDFTWTAMDYLGEAGIGHSLLSDQPDSFFMAWPWFNAWCGDLDLCGFKKPQSYYRDVVWRRSPIEMLVHAPIPPGENETVSQWGWPEESKSWNWPGQEGKPLQVSVYTRCETVRLELNGKVVGEIPVSADSKLTAKFDVPYAAGDLIAYGLSQGTIVAKTVLVTSGIPKKVKLSVDRPTIRATPNDLCYVTVEIEDANGRRVPNAEIPVRFSVTGAGELAAQSSAKPNEPASFHAPECRTFQGKCLAILRPNGSEGAITLRAEADGLEAGTVSVEADGSPKSQVSRAAAFAHDRDLKQN